MATNPASGKTEEVLVEGKVARDSRTPEHGNPAENLSPHESVINVRVGSEAAVASGTDPVLPPEAAVVSEQTKVHNKDLQERDKKEREKRGPDGGVHDVSMSFPGLMAIEVDGEVHFRSGSFTGRFHDSIKVRPLTEEEIEEQLPSAAPADRPAVQRRQQDLIKGAGQGGGGNPMKAGEARGTTSNPTQPAGGAAATSGPRGGSVTSRGPR